jgi:ribosome-binding protein aMBF1 (putative translation factor)
MSDGSTVCDGCGRDTDSTVCREVDDSLFELCFVCDPYSDVSLAATAQSVQDELVEESAAAESSFEDFRDDAPKLAAQFKGRHLGLENARRRLGRITGGLK